MNIDYEAISKACEKLNRRCYEIPAGHHHGAAWLYDQVMRVFSHPAATGVTYKVCAHAVGECYATINRDGSLVMSRNEPQ